MKITVVGSGFVGQTTAMRVLEKGLATRSCSPTSWKGCPRVWRSI